MATQLTLNTYNATVIGTDNVSPVINTSTRWQIWNMNEIYLGTVGAGKYVPAIGDEVHEIVGSLLIRYIVIDINATTLVAVMRQESTTTETNALSQDDILLGVGPGTPSDTYRVYLDRSVMPYRLSVDARLFVGGSLTAACKLFKGANIADSGIVVSGVYNQNGQLISEAVPLELVGRDTLINHAIKVVAPCHTTADLVNGELVTAVLYDAQGFVVSKRQLLVENTGFIRSADANRHFVVGISLETPFKSVANDRLIQYPLNVPLNAINLVGVVHYNDGSSSRLAVDGTRFSVAGLDAYAATVVGQKNELVLKYALGPNEVAYGAYVGTDTHISEIYTIQTANASGSYAVQLYAYPVWVDLVTGYRLEWFLYDLDRGIRYSVTPHVRVNTAVRAYDGKAYGQMQTLSVSINLRDVNGTYRNFIHVQYLDFLLNKPASGRPNLDHVPNWNVSVKSSQLVPFGQNVYATYLRMGVNMWLVKLDAGLSTYEAWLDRFYWPTAPLFDPYRETRAPLPTHFTLVAGGTSVEYPVSAWNGALRVNQSLTNGSTVFLKFFTRTVDTDLHLSVAGASLFQVDANGNFA